MLCNYFFQVYPNEYMKCNKKYTRNCTHYQLSYSFTIINTKTFKETTNSIVMPFSHLRLVTSICEPLCIWTCVCPHMCLIHMLNINWKHKFTFRYMSNKIEHRTKIRKKQRNNLYHQLYAYWPDGWVSKLDLYRLFNCSQSHFSN